ncbi:MAG: hypothetical protein JO316_21805 [Abitibacteriaceae bacterium]|nr:hypothetical protein [Abditibacteriaceae bacterium]
MTRGNGSQNARGIKRGIRGIGVVGWLARAGQGGGTLSLLLLLCLTGLVSPLRSDAATTYRIDELPATARWQSSSTQVAKALNNLGQVIGQTVSTPQRGVLYNQGVVTDLGTLGSSNAALVDINNTG